MKNPNFVFFKYFRHSFCFIFDIAPLNDLCARRDSFLQYKLPKLQMALKKSNADHKTNNWERAEQRASIVYRNWYCLPSCLTANFTIALNPYRSDLYVSHRNQWYPASAMCQSLLFSYNHLFAHRIQEFLSQSSTMFAFRFHRRRSGKRIGAECH